MKYVIDEEVCKKSHLEMPLVLTILLLNTGTEFKDNVQELIDREIIIEEKTLLGTKYLITNKWIDAVSNILLDSEKSNADEFNDKLEALSKRLMEVFPAGKKPGTTIYWKGNCRDIRLRLKKFFKKYGDTYTDEQIVGAAQAYVNSFNGDYSYMRVLKYFIWKDERKLDADGHLSVEEVSDLATILENAGQVDNDSNWRDSVR
jgi:hypothetical protein